MRLGTKLGLAALVLFAAGAVAAQEARSQGWGDAMRGMKDRVMGMMGGGMMGGGKMGDGMMGGGAGAERPNVQWRRNAPGASAPDPAKHEPR